MSNEVLDGKGKGKMPMTMDDERKGGQGEKNENTFQSNFSSLETIINLAKQTRKEPCNEFILSDGVTPTRVNLTLALVQVIRDLGGKASPKSSTNLEGRAKLESRTTLKAKAHYSKNKANPKVGEE